LELLWSLAVGIWSFPLRPHLPLDRLGDLFGPFVEDGGFAAFGQQPRIGFDVRKTLTFGARLAPAVKLWHRLSMRKSNKRQFNVIVERDTEGYYVASVPELAGCHTQARSLDKLIERIREAIELCLGY